MLLVSGNPSSACTIRLIKVPPAEKMDARLRHSGMTIPAGSSNVASKYTPLCPARNVGHDKLGKGGIERGFLSTHGICY
jgi:hypothetical protein